LKHGTRAWPGLNCSEFGPVAGFCKYGYEPSSFIKGGELT